VPVGVIYASDMALVRTTLQNAASALDEPWVVKDRDPQVIMTEFGDHSVNWELALWINDPWEWRPALSAVHEAIWRAFKKQNIVIAFPQLDVHLDAPVVESFERISRPAA
jgi:small-conductance mechanosensitive channel